MNDIWMYGGEHINAYLGRITEDPFYTEDEWHIGYIHDDKYCGKNISSSRKVQDMFHEYKT